VLNKIDVDQWLNKDCYAISKIELDIDNQPFHTCS